jgi:hypothetical protein
VQLSKPRSPLYGANVFTGVIGAAIGFIIGVWIGNRVGIPSGE